jgi:hypothetical protein
MDRSYASIKTDPLGGFDTDEIRLEARDLLGCHGNDTVNDRAIFGSDLKDSKSHYLCITGDPDQGEGE